MSATMNQDATIAVACVPPVPSIVEVAKKKPFSGICVDEFDEIQSGPLQVLQLTMTSGSPSTGSVSSDSCSASTRSQISYGSLSTITANKSLKKRILMGQQKAREAEMDNVGIAPQVNQVLKASTALMKREREDITLLIPEICFPNSEVQKPVAVRPSMKHQGKSQSYRSPTSTTGTTGTSTNNVKHSSLSPFVLSRSVSTSQVQVPTQYITVKDRTHTRTLSATTSTTASGTSGTSRTTSISSNDVKNKKDHSKKVQSVAATSTTTPNTSRRRLLTKVQSAGCLHRGNSLKNVAEHEVHEHTSTEQGDTEHGGEWTDRAFDDADFDDNLLVPSGHRGRGRSSSRRKSSRARSFVRSLSRTFSFKMMMSFKRQNVNEKDGNVDKKKVASGTKPQSRLGKIIIDVDDVSAIRQLQLERQQSLQSISVITTQPSKRRNGQSQKKGVGGGGGGGQLPPNTRYARKPYTSSKSARWRSQRQTTP